MATAEYDREADALYIRLLHGDVARTVDVDDYRAVDFGADGAVLGIEVLYPAQGHLTLAPIAMTHGFADALDEIDAAVREALGSPGSVEAVTYTMQLQYTLPPAGGPAGQPSGGTGREHHPDATLTPA